MVSAKPFGANPRKPVKGDKNTRIVLDSVKKDFIVNINLSGRYVRVEIPWKENLQLAEVEVYSKVFSPFSSNKGGDRSGPKKPSSKPSPKKKCTRVGLKEICF